LGLLKELLRWFAAHPGYLIALCCALYVALGPSLERILLRLEETKNLAWVVGLLVWHAPEELVGHLKRRARRRRRMKRPG
jgi:hypothetical protein